MDTQQGGVKSKISQSPQSLQCSVPPADTAPPSTGTESRKHGRMRYNVPRGLGQLPGFCYE